MTSKQFDAIKEVVNSYLSNGHKREAWGRVAAVEGSKFFQILTPVGTVTFEVKPEERAVPVTRLAEPSNWGITANLKSIFCNSWFESAPKVIPELLDIELAEARKLMEKIVVCFPSGYPGGSFVLAESAGRCWWIKPPAQPNAIAEASFRSNPDTVSGIYTVLPPWFAPYLSDNSVLQPIATVALGGLKSRAVLRVAVAKYKMVVSACGGMLGGDDNRITFQDQAATYTACLRGDGTFVIEEGQGKGEEMKTKVIDPTILIKDTPKEDAVVVAEAPAITIDGDRQVDIAETPAVVEEVQSDLPEIPEPQITAIKPEPQEPQPELSVADCFGELDELISSLETGIKSARKMFKQLQKAYKQEAKEAKASINNNAEFLSLQAENKKLAAKLKSITSIIS